MRCTFEKIALRQIDDIAPCVYYIYFKTDLMYIGKTKSSLIGRMFSHIRDEKSKVGEQIRRHIGLVKREGWFDTPFWDVTRPEGLMDWSVEAIEVVGNIDECEQRAIKTLHPLLNVQYQRP